MIRRSARNDPTAGCVNINFEKPLNAMVEEYMKASAAVQPDGLKTVNQLEEELAQQRALTALQAQEIEKLRGRVLELERELRTVSQNLDNLEYFYERAAKSA